MTNIQTGEQAVQPERAAPIQLGDNERLIGALLGGGFFFVGLSRRSLFGLLVAAGGLTLAKAAISGRGLAGAFSTAETGEAQQQLPPTQSPGFPEYSGGYEPLPEDEVEEASMESFPASDAPSYGARGI